MGIPFCISLTAAREVAEDGRVMKAIIICVVALSASLFAASVNGGQTAPKPAAASLMNPVAATPQSIAAGQASYQKYCRSCHGDAGKGDGKMAPNDPKPADLTDATWDHGSADAEIFKTISDGVPPKFVMKGFKSRMTAQEIWNIVNYLRSLRPEAAPK
jgi:mono/diheme cytochrome c family protein